MQSLFEKKEISKHEKRVADVPINISMAGLIVKAAPMPFEMRQPIVNPMVMSGLQKHPGGSIHDQDSIDYCEKNHMGMAITGFRHFKH